MPEPTRPLTPDQALLDVKKRSRSLRVLLDHIGVRKFKEELPGLQPIKVPIDFSSTLETAKFIYGVVKAQARRNRQEVLGRRPVSFNPHSAPAESHPPAVRPRT